MNKIIHNTLIYLAVVSSILLILDGELELFLIILALGTLVSYITKNILVLIGAAFIFVYLKEYNAERKKERENIAGLAAGAAVLLGGFGAGIGGYYAGKAIDGGGNGRLKKAKDIIPDKFKKFRDKAFPGLLGSDSASIINNLKEQNTKALMNLINPTSGDEEDGDSAPVSYGTLCPEGEYFKPKFAEDSPPWNCTFPDKKDCCGPPFSPEWEAYMKQPERSVAKGTELGVKCWALPGNYYLDESGENCLSCPSGTKIKEKEGSNCEGDEDKCCESV